MRVKLTSYQIEEGQKIRLDFSDGSVRTVSTDELPLYLKGRELARVRQGLELRRRYFKRILPPWAQVMVGITLLLIALSGTRVAGWYRYAPQPPKAPPRPSIQTTAAPAPAAGTAAATEPEGDQKLQSGRAKADRSSAQRLAHPGDLDSHKGDTSPPMAARAHAEGLD